MNNRRQLLAGVVVTVAAIGCSSPAGDSSGESPLTGAPGLAAAPVDVELRRVDRAAYDAAIDVQRGKVVLVDFWATWCTPCLAQLPHTAELATRLADDGLVVFTVSLDEPEDEAKVKRALAARTAAAPVEHLLSELGGGSAAMEAFHIASGSVPHYKLYDRTGKLRRTFETDPTAERPFTPDDIDAATAELLEEKR